MLNLSIIVDNITIFSDNGLNIQVQYMSHLKYYYVNFETKQQILYSIYDIHYLSFIWQGLCNYHLNYHSRVNKCTTGLVDGNILWDYCMNNPAYLVEVVCQCCI